jgi:Tfp pilus assembly protein PilO
MGSTNRLFVSILVVAVLAIGFWVLLLGPKREEANELGAQVDTLQLSLQSARGEVAQAQASKRDFPADYRQLVVLGEAVPASDETASLLVEVDKIAADADVEFDSIQIEGTGEAAAPVATTPTAAPATGAPTVNPTESTSAVPASATIPPTEVAASVLPLGATVGAAGLGVMPYSLSFRGSFFHVADFIQGVNRLVHTTNSRVAVDGRLITLDGFALTADPEKDFPYLNASFKITTFLVPPSQGLTVGATPAEPVPASTTAPPAAEEGSASEAPAESSETVAAQ